MHFAKKLFLGAALTASAVLGAAHADAPAVPSGSYNLEPTHASLVWRVNHLGLSNYTARFTGFDVKLTLDSENIGNSSVTASIDPLSVETDYPGKTDFNAEISSDPKFLNASAYPAITFKSTKVEQTGDTTALIHGDMTMLGVTKPVTLQATLNGVLPSHPYAKVPAVGFHAEGTIKRSDFGFKHLLPYVGDEVSFVIEAEFLKAE